MASRIITKKGSGAPLASDLVHGELAVDTVNKRLYTENAGGTVVELGTSPSTIDINAGTIDDTVIGGTTAAAGTFTTGQFDTSVNVDGTVTADGLTVAADALNSQFSAATGTSFFYQRFSSDGGNHYLGVSSSAGAGLLSGAGAYSFCMLTESARNLAFGTNNATRMLIDSTGNVGIGTSSPTAKLDVLTAGGFSVGRFSNGTTQVALGASSDNSAFIEVPQAQPLRFLVNAGERMRIDSSGNVGIGTSSPSQKLHVVGKVLATDNLEFSTADTAIVFQSGAGRFFTGGTERMRIDSSGNLLVGTTSNVNSGGHVLEKNGNGLNSLEVTNSATSDPYGPWFRFSNASPNNATVYFLLCSDNTATRASILSNGGFANYQANDTNLSDERVKTDIAPLGSMWDKFKALEIVTFKYKDQTHDDNNIGVIAQQVEAVAPEFVDNEGFGETPEGETPLKAIYTADLYHAAIKALQEAMTRIETLEIEVAALKGAN